MYNFYFPKKKNIKPLTSDQLSVIHKSLHLLDVHSKDDLPFSIYNGEVDYYCDEGMNLENGVLGYTTFFRQSEVLLSPIIVEGLDWKNSFGVLNNESSMEIVVHELTHLAQMRWLRGLLYVFLHIPFIDQLFLEKWANINGKLAKDRLSYIYRQQTTKILRERQVRNGFE